MSDIIITLDATDAIKDADKLTRSLDRLELKAKEVKRAVKKFLLAGNVTLKAKRLATDMRTIQTQINARKIFARVLLRVDKRSLKGLQSQIRTHTGRGAGLLTEMGMKKAPGGGWFAAEKPPIDKFFPVGEKDPRYGTFKTHEKEQVEISKRMEKAKKELKDFEKVGERIRKKAPKTAMDTRIAYDDLNTTLNASANAYRQGNVSQKEFARVIQKSGKQTKILEKEHKKLKSKTFMNIQAETGITDATTSGLVQTFEKLSDNTIWGIPQIYEAYKTLRKEGLGANAAIKQIMPTLKIARNADMDLAKAARMAAHDTMGLREQYLKLDKEVSRSSGESWQKLKKSIANVFEGVYMKMEPRLVEVLERLNSFIRENKDNLIAGLEKLAEVVLNISEFFAGATLNIINFIGEANKLSKIKQQEGLFEQLADYQQSLNTWKAVEKKLQKRIDAGKKVAPEYFKTVSATVIRLTAKVENLTKKIRDLNTITGKVEPLKGETDITYTEADRLKGYQSAFSKMKGISDEYYRYRLKQINIEETKQVAMFTKAGDAGSVAFAVLAAAHEKYNLHWQQQSNYMGQNAKLFKATSIMSDDYYRDETT